MDYREIPEEVRAALHRGVVIPALPLALNRERKLDERRQRALVRYYMDAGAGGLAVAVHTTQFGIRLPWFGLLEPVLSIAAEELDRVYSAYPHLNDDGFVAENLNRWL